MKIDCHVHCMADGSSGTGCYIRLSSLFHKALAQIILRQLGLKSSCLGTDLDRQYAELLTQLLATSSLDKIVVLAHEEPYTPEGSKIEKFGSFYVSNEYVLEIAKRHSNFIPGIAVHPARPDAIDELEKGAANGAKILKLLPNCQNVNCLDVRYKRFWQRCSELGLILLAHTGGELSVPVYNAAYADPSLLRGPLEEGVKVIAAHCGTSSHYFDRDYTDTFISLLSSYPNLYGDNSGLNTPLRCRHFKRLLAEGVHERIVHGSDIPIPTSGLWVFLRGMIGRNAYAAIRRERNPLERDFQIKRALGFPEATFTRLASLL